MRTEKGTLPIGIERDGKFHRDYEIRLGLVKDTIEVVQEQDADKLDNSHYFGACLTAKQILSIGDISPVKSDDVLAMYDDDLGEINEAKARLLKRIISFRDSLQEQQEEGAGADSARTDQTGEEAGPVAPETALSDGSGS